MKIASHLSDLDGVHSPGFPDYVSPLSEPMVSETFCRVRENVAWRNGFYLGVGVTVVAGAAVLMLTVIF